MKKLILILLSLALLQSCAETSTSNKSSSSVVDGNNNLSFSLRWTAPQLFENGNMLVAENDLLEYRVYYGDSLEHVTDNMISIEGTSTFLSSSNLDENLIESLSTVYIAMTSVSSDGIESALSSIVKFPP